MDRRDGFCIALLIAVATVFFSDVLFAGNNFFYRDLFVYHFPMKRVVRDAMLGGELPFWNWSYANGQPLAANPAYELWYPMQWLILIGSYPFGFALHIVAHVYVALAGMFVLLRELPLGRAASTFGALSFGMGGLLLGSSTMLPTFFVWALAPLVAWSVLRTVRAPAADRFALAALVAGAQLTIGEPVATAQVWLLIAIGVCFAGRRRAIVVVAAIIVAAIAVSAVQLIPALDHAHDSSRARGLPFTTVREFAMPAARPLEIFVPHLYGVASPFVNGFWGSAAFDRGAPYLESLYDGVFVAILVAAGFVLRARGWLTVALLAVASYVLAIGDRTPLLRILYSSGIVRGIRYPEKFAAFGVVALTVFAATIADRLLAGDVGARRAAIIGAIVTVAIAAVPLIWFTDSFVGDKAGIARTEWTIALVIALSAGALVLLQPRMPRRIWLLLALLVVLFDLVPLANELTPRMPASFFTPPGVVASLSPDRNAHALMNRADWMNYTGNYHAVVRELGPWFPRNSVQPFTPAAWNLRSALELDLDETALLPTHHLLDAMKKDGNSGDPHWAETFAAISNVDTIVDLLPLADIYRQPHDLPHVRIVRLTHVPAIGRYAIRRGSGRVTHVEERANAATVDVEASSDVLLVITITRHKYWHATIDGAEVPLLPINIAYQSLIVPPGRHRIELRYRNPVVIRSGIVSAVAVAACFAAIVIAPTRRRLRPRSGS